MMVRWILRKYKSNGRRSNELGTELPEMLQAIASERADGDLDGYLNSKLAQLKDPFEMPGMEEAVALVLRAIREHRRIVVFGDYDVDGVSAIALIARFLEAWETPVQAFLPERLVEGYGLSVAAVERCLLECAPDLLIVLDCGTNSREAAALLRERGVEIVIIDHHEPTTPVENVPLVNPKMGDADTGLCTAGLVFKFCHALQKRADRREPDLRAWLDLAALGTVADVAPLRGENRILVRNGLVRMAKTRWPGLRALLDITNVSGVPRAGDIGYRLGPRINAAGRLGTAQAALDLLMSTSPAVAAPLAEELHRCNGERQQVEKTCLREAERQIDPDALPAAIVLGDVGWHQGVVGIVASRLMRRYWRPVFIVAMNPDGSGKGSGRGIDGVSLIALLNEAAPFLAQYGGHHAAAGVTLRPGGLDGFRAAICEAVVRTVPPEKLVPRLMIDGLVNPAGLDFDFMKAHERLQPFGAANSQPVFAMAGVSPARAPLVRKERHLEIHLALGARTLRVMWFDGALEPLPPPPWDVAFQLNASEFRGESRMDVIVQGLRAASNDWEYEAG